MITHYSRRTVLAAMAGGSAAIAMPNISRAATNTVRIGWCRFANNAPFILMNEQAKALGLDLKMIEFQRFPEVRVALASGAVDVGMLGPIDVAFAAAAANDIVVLAGAATGADLMAKRAGLGAVSWDDLKNGKYKLGSFGAGIAWLKTVKTMEEKGIDFARVQTVNVAGSVFDMMQTLRQKSTDVAMAVDPFIAQGVAAGYAEYADELDINASSVGSQNSVLGMTGAFAKQPGAGEVLSGFLKAIDQLKGDRKLWIRTYQGYGNLDEKTAEESLKRITLTHAFDQAGLTNLAAFLFAKGLIQKDVTALAGKYYDYAPIAKLTGATPKSFGAAG